MHIHIDATSTSICLTKLHLSSDIIPNMIPTLHHAASSSDHLHPPPSALCAVTVAAHCHEAMANLLLIRPCLHPHLARTTRQLEHANQCSQCRGEQRGNHTPFPPRLWTAAGVLSGGGAALDTRNRSTHNMDVVIVAKRSHMPVERTSRTEVPMMHYHAVHCSASTRLNTELCAISKHRDAETPSAKTPRHLDMLMRPPQFRQKEAQLAFKARWAQPGSAAPDTRRRDIATPRHLDA